MTTTDLELGYLNQGGYLSQPYLANMVLAQMGMQATIVIKDDAPIGMQSEITIDKQAAYGMQAENTVSLVPPYGMQAEVVIEDNTPLAMQAEIVIGFEDSVGMQATNTNQSDTAIGMQSLLQNIDKLFPVGMQAEITVRRDSDVGMQAEILASDFTKFIGQEALIADHYHLLCGGGYLSSGYLSGPYLANQICVPIHMQAEIINVVEHQIGQQIEATINAQNANGQQAEATINTETAFGQQAETTINDEFYTAMQALGIIKDDKVVGMQALARIVDKLFPVGMQADIVRTFPVGFQARIAIYNTTNLRILCDFASRGLTASNWTANTTATGDFNINNVNTDIVEQTWRSASGIKTGITLDCDTGVTQGVSIDTIVMLGMNLTSSATVNVLASNDPAFGVINDTLQMQIIDDKAYHIVEQASFPLTQSRYFRFVIDDGTNTADYLEIGTILFGAADIFQGECFTDQIRFADVDFADKISTEGFTNVSNSRALKRSLGLEFRSLDYGQRNFNILKDLFRASRTTHKCMWIPTPDADDASITDRYAVFGKLPQIPQEQHNNKGPNLTYVDFTVDVDESL